MNKPLVAIVLALVVIGAGAWYFWGASASPKTPTILERATSENRPVRVAIINYLRILEGPNNGLKQGMKALGYEEGKNIAYTSYYGDGNFEKMVADAKDVIQNNKADIIVGNPGEGGQAALQAAQELGSNIPVLYMLSFDPLAMKLINSYQSSGNQVTGVAVDLGYLTGKRLEFLHQIAPNAKKLGIITGVKALDITATKGRDEVMKQAPKFGFEVVEYTVDVLPGPTSDQAVIDVTKKIKAGEIDAFYRMLGPVTSTPGTIAAYAAMGERLKIPTEFFGHEQGSLLNYDNDYDDAGVQLATLVDKVLKGATPTSIPSENARKYILEIDLRVANKIGIKVPDSLLSIATKVTR
ncbi:MAG TPA: ABC transporter substrate-binding protein [Candidatus Paceibacterota bacterium]|uniref:ABC transporter substrate-binding protein n=1 Tax=Candidatus Taylorbacteria bacterium RIFCSPHIGHO2_01_FULL_51_15 TaxID=1802304 RepID=A0A1G2MCH6_9BACT|nr:MAG: hypothetical protein A2849_02380 [Candidatus Taylorbacteria bacterium RIFCSPHIGHO2_01_FULL_51_15]